MTPADPAGPPRRPLLSFQRVVVGVSLGCAAVLAVNLYLVRKIEREAAEGSPFRFVAADRGLPDLGEAPSFRFTDQTGAPFGSSDLAGKPYVADFVFTRCPDVCPRLTAILAGLQDRRLAGEGEPPFRLLSVSVDPEYDTPEVLAAYARGHGVKEKAWRFVTGPHEETRRVIEGGFKISMGAVAPAAGGGEAGHEGHPGHEGHQGHEGHGAAAAPPLPTLHGNSFVLVDGKGRVRGYYSPDDAGVRRLEKDLDALSGGA